MIMDHIFFLAWVSERYQGTPTRPILNACELNKTIMTDEPIYPSMANISQVLKASCSQTKEFDIELVNIGTQALTSLKFNAVVGNVNYDFEWNGELASGDKTMLSFEMDIPFGSFTGVLNITEANGNAFASSKQFAVESAEWAESELDGDVTKLKVYIIQDQFGEQTTWNIVNSNGEIIAEGGPYDHLVGAGATNLNVKTINNVPTDECYLFRIFDTNNNGICCAYGEGYYYIKDDNGDRIVDGDGAFGAMASHSFMLKRQDSVEDNAVSSFNIYPNPANSKIYVDGEDVSVVEVYNSLGQKVLTVEGSEHTSVNVASFENGVYMIRVITDNGEISTQKVTIAH